VCRRIIQAGVFLAGRHTSQGRYAESLMSWPRPLTGMTSRRAAARPDAALAPSLCREVSLVCGGKNRFLLAILLAKSALKRLEGDSHRGSAGSSLLLAVAAENHLCGGRDVVTGAANQRCARGVRPAGSSRSGWAGCPTPRPRQGKPVGVLLRTRKIRPSRPLCSAPYPRRRSSFCW